MWSACLSVSSSSSSETTFDRTDFKQCDTDVSPNWIINKLRYPWTEILIDRNACFQSTWFILKRLLPVHVVYFETLASSPRGLFWNACFQSTWFILARARAHYARATVLNLYAIVRAVSIQPHFAFRSGQNYLRSDHVRSSAPTDCIAFFSSFFFLLLLLLLLLLLQLCC